jgi:hypothetical protein
MRPINSLIPLFLLGAVMTILANAAGAAPETRMPHLRRAAQAVRTVSDGIPPMQEQVTVLDPFFVIRQKGAKVWVERIIVTLTLTTPEHTIKQELNGPMIRKMLYDLVQSGKPEDSCRMLAVAGLQRQLGVEAEVHLSRSILIVR